MTQFLIGSLSKKGANKKRTEKNGFPGFHAIQTTENTGPQYVKGAICLFSQRADPGFPESPRRPHSNLPDIPLHIEAHHETQRILCTCRKRCNTRPSKLHFAGNWHQCCSRFSVQSFLLPRFHRLFSILRPLHKWRCLGILVRKLRN